MVKIVAFGVMRLVRNVIRTAMSRLVGRVSDILATRAIRLAAMVHIVSLTTIPAGPHVIAPLAVVVCWAQHPAAVVVDVVTCSSMAESGRSRGGFMLAVARGHHGALEVLILTIRWPVAELDGGNVVPAVVSIGCPRIPRHLLPRGGGIREPAMLACWGRHTRGRARGLWGRSIVQGVCNGVGKVPHQCIWKARDEDGKHVRSWSGPRGHGAHRVLGEAVLGSVRHGARQSAPAGWG